MTTSRPFSHIIDRLRGAGLRPTRQRLALAKMLFDGPDRHITAEMLHKESGSNGVSVSLATVYNTLNQFTTAGLLREIVVDGDRSYFDTNTSNHHHFYDAGARQLADIDNDEVVLKKLPTAPEGTRISRVDIIVRVENIV